MDVNADLDLVKSDLDQRINRTNSRRQRDKRKAAFVAVYTGVVSAITTICIGIVTFLPSEWSNLFGIASLLTSTSLTVVDAWDGIFGHKRLWINAQSTLNAFKGLRYDIKHVEATSASGVPQETINDIYRSYKNILEESHQKWMNLRE